MKKLLLTAAFSTLAAAALAATESSPLWLRNTAISPDGQTIAFTYRGDIYTVPFAGGAATRITTDQAHDTRPVWSPDGKRLAFASDRDGSQDVYIVDANGGEPVRLTTHSGSEVPLAFADNGTIIFAGNIMPSRQAINGYVFNQLYTVSANGGRPRLLLSLPSDALSVDAQGRILYTDKKGYEDKFRKHEQSSGTSDVWLVEGALKGKPVFRQLTATPYHSINPQWGSGDIYYYVNEADATLNVYAADLKGGKPRQLTHFSGNPVRSLTVAPDGRMAFSQNGEIYVMDNADAQPRRLGITITADNPERREQAVRRTSASNMAVSPSGEEVAVVVRGDIFVTPADYSTTRQVTATTGQEREVSFSPDGRFMVYDSERDGLWQLYKAEIGKDDLCFAYAQNITETPLNTGEGNAFQPVISPDGKKVAFLRNRTELCVLDLGTGAVTTVMDGKFAYSYTDGDLSYRWHPDSEWILFNGYIGTGGWNNSDVAAISTDGKQIINLTESGYSDGNARWTPDGRGVLYESDRRGFRSHGSWGAQNDVFVMWLDPAAYEKFTRTKEEVALDEKREKAAKKAAKDTKKDDKKKGKKDAKKADKPAKAPLDFANRKDRRLRLTPNSSSLGDYWLNPKGDKLYYVAAFENDGDLWVADIKEGTTKLLKKGWGFGELVPDSASKKLFTLNRGRVKSIDLSNNEVKNIDFDARSTFSAPAERDYIYSHMKALVNNKFHDVNLHGTDWEQATDNYARFLPYINNRNDFAEVLSEVLGELNASHTGGRAYGSGNALTATSYLGAFFDEEYSGDGLRISEVIAKGPLSTKPEVKPGTIITAIDGQTIKADQDYFPLLAGKAGRDTRLTLTLPDGTTKTITVKPISQGTNRSLLRDRWVARNQAIVDSLSGGRIGYVSIQGMNSPSFREVYEQALGKYRNCDALIVDTRYNGGGWLHNDVALLLSGKKYVDYAPRGQYIGSDPFSQWTKPSAMLINECNYSDAHGTPFTYKTLGLGKLIGAPVPGTMTAVWWENQVDPQLVFGVPQVTSLDSNGKMLENQQLNPDILIYNQPGDVLEGIDAQLAGAVKALMQSK